MSDEVEQTPYAEAVALQAGGAASEAIAARLRLRGLDDEAIKLLLNAVGSRAVDAPAPRAEWTQPAEAAPPDVPRTLPSSTCPRCGVFLEVESYELVLGKAYCRACAARPDVNYPRAYRDEHWGKREGWAWFMGFLALVALLSGAFTLTQNPALGGALILSGVGYLLFWSGAKVGRPALVGVTALGVVLSLAQGQPPNVLAIAFVVLAMRSARTKLFFEMEVPEADLAAAWMAQHDNRPAQYALALGLISLATLLTWMGSWKFAFGTLALGLVAVVLGVVGVRRVKPDAIPPVGRKTAALIGGLGGALAVLAAAVHLLQKAGVF